MSNTVNVCENMSAPDNKYDILIANLHEEIEELCKTSEAKFLFYDGKVAELCTYIKANLSNSIQCLLSDMKLSGELDEIVSDIVLLQYKELEFKTDCLIKKIGKVYTPEMYGACGDGICDDTEAFLLMIEDIEKELPEKTFINELSCKDYSSITLRFTGNYAISKPLIFNTTYGLTIDNLKLIALKDFEGEGMLLFENITRNLKCSNITINAGFEADSCIVIKDYTLTIDLNNIEITHFKKYGIYATGKGHEIKGVNIRINQYEWGEKENLDKTKNGIGLYLGTERHDNNFTNLIINYCNDYGIKLLGGTTKFVNSHFYSCEILNKGQYNTFNACYFDNAPFKTDGFFNLSNSLLLKSGIDTKPFIYFTVETAEYYWKYETSILNGNAFKSENQVNKAIDLGELTEMPNFNTIGNTFYYVTPFTSIGRLGHTRNPWDMERSSYGDETAGYKIYGNLAIIWGHATENGFVTYPNNIELSETIHISFERQDNTNPNLIPWANTIKSNKFWINSVGNNSTVKWVVIGIVK